MEDNSFWDQGKLPVVTLRAIEPEDLDVLYTIENDDKLWTVGSTNVPYSRYALHEYVANTSGDIYADRQVRLMVCNEQEEVVGIVDLMDFNPRHLRAEVGVVIQKPYRAEGYGQAAMQKLISYARNILHIHQLYALVGVDNTYCIRLFEHAGFLSNARLRDWLSDGNSYHDAVLMQLFIRKSINNPDCRQ